MTLANGLVLTRNCGKYALTSGDSASYTGSGKFGVFSILCILFVRLHLELFHEFFKVNPFNRRNDFLHRWVAQRHKLFWTRVCRRRLCKKAISCRLPLRSTLNAVHELNPPNSIMAAFHIPPGSSSLSHSVRSRTHRPGDDCRHTGHAARCGSGRSIVILPVAAWRPGLGAHLVREYRCHGIF